MKAFVLVGALVLSTASSVVASVTVPVPEPTSDIEKVKALSDRLISGSDVRKTVDEYENTDHNPCAADGLSYIVKVELRRSTIEMDPKTGEAVQSRKWEEFNTYYVSKKDLDAGKGLSDTLCQE